MLKHSFNGLKVYVTNSGVVVFRPHGRYIRFTNIDIALDILFRPLTSEFTPNFVVVSENDTQIIF